MVKFCSEKTPECSSIGDAWGPLLDELREQNIFLAVVSWLPLAAAARLGCRSRPPQPVWGCSSWPSTLAERDAS